jgi:diguanylate cyclase (GGDEF)-like protein
MPYLLATFLLLTLGALAVLLHGRRTLRREVEKHAREREQERAARLQAEQTLRTAREELERETRASHEALGDMRRELDRLGRELETARGRLDRVARVDELTGLANRSRFEEALEREIKRTIREKASLSILVCAIDYFDEYARRRDERQCDQAVFRIAHAVEDVFRRAGDLIARYGQSRFAVILPATDAEAAARFGERVRKSVWELCIPHEASQAAERMTISTGAATMAPSRLRTPADLVQAAEAALLRAHASGYNRVEQTLLS